MHRREVGEIPELLHLRRKGGGMGGGWRNEKRGLNERLMQLDLRCGLSLNFIVHKLMKPVGVECLVTCSESTDVSQPGFKKTKNKKKFGGRRGMQEGLVSREINKLYSSVSVSMILEKR